MSNRFAVFTAIFGNRDHLREPLCNNVDFIVFTDQPIQSKRVRIIHVDGLFKDPARNARYVRALVHNFLPEYDVTLWLDASFVLKDVDGLLSYLDNSDLVVSRHYQRNCIYEEATVCIAYQRDRKDIIEPQMNRYRAEGYPVGNGLVEVGALLRRNSESVKLFNEAWWHEITNGSRHDQLSFNYVAWKLGFKFGLFEWNNVRETRFWSFMDHSGPESIPVQ